MHIVSQRPGVLLVQEDGEARAIRDFTLGHFGWAVRLADSGREAVTLYRHHGQGIAVVLVDLPLPDLDGPRLLAALQEVNADVRVVVLAEDAKEGTPRGAARVLHKPSTGLLRLAQALQEVSQRRG
jgi:CheY-like chemotaxis protein